MAEHGNSEHHGGGPSFYLLIALILGVLTFVEFAVVHWPQAWLGTAITVTSLIVMSVAKFLLVVAYFMHLRDDENTYSGFFASGMVIAMGTFVVLAFLFTVPSVANALSGGGHEVAAEHGEEEGHHGVPEEVLASIESDGYSRETAAILDSPRPKSQALVLIPPPVEGEGDFTLGADPLFGSAAPGATDDPDAVDSADAEPVDAEPEPTDSVDPEPADEGPLAQAAAEVDLDAGLEVFNRNCVGCHQTSGAGIPGAFPPLAGHAADLYAADGGRAYLINVLLYGLQGSIEVEGSRYNGVMPAWAQLTDDDLATVLDYILNAWEGGDAIADYQPYTADEIAAARDAGLAPADVLEQRGALELP